MPPTASRGISRLVSGYRFLDRLVSVGYGSYALSKFGNTTKPFDKLNTLGAAQEGLNYGIGRWIRPSFIYGVDGSGNCFMRAWVISILCKRSVIYVSLERIR